MLCANIAILSGTSCLSLCLFFPLTEHHIHTLSNLFQKVKKLQAILKPMMLRRLKDDVEKNLAPKEETIIEVGLCFRVCLI